MTRFLDLLDAQRGRQFLWLPVFYALGIGLYFALPLEPAGWIYILLAAAVMGGALMMVRLSPFARAPFWIVLIFVNGFLIAGLRAHSVAENVLTFRYYGPVEGRVVQIDRSGSNAVRLTLDQVVLKDVRYTPAKVRISLHGEGTAQAGDRVHMIAHLSPPSGPAEPEGFDFQRMAWFDRLGAVGYTRKPIEVETARAQWGLMIVRFKHRLSEQLRARMTGDRGAFAAAILTGDRSGVTPELSEALRATNLSHLLAISGLHMGLLTGAVFTALRVLLVLIPKLALRVPIKKLAALGAMVAGFFYLALSGWNVATERAFIMVSMMFLAILCDRQALSLRAVAMAALVILTFRPEVLTEPGFQMSFAATTALVAVFSKLRRFETLQRRSVRILSGIVLSSFIAGVATLPVAAAHFNRIADYGLLANILAVPMMGAIVMPSAVLAGVLTPFGLEGIALWIMELGIGWILGVAETISRWEGAVRYVPTPPRYSLPLIALGALIMILWRGWAWRFGGVGVILGFALWMGAERPAMLISEDGGLLGVMTSEGRALSKPKGAGFAARVWLENDGDVPSQARAAAREMGTLELNGVRIAHITGRGWEARLPEACARHDVVIVNQDILLPDEPCVLFDLYEFRRAGSMAFWPTQDGLRVQTARQVSGVRLWNTPQLKWGSAREAKEKLPRFAFGGVITAQ